MFGTSSAGVSNNLINPFLLSQQCIYASLFKIHPLGQKIVHGSRGTRTRTSAPTSTGSTPKPIIRESQSQFENRIMARVYERSITRSTMYQKNSILLAGTFVWKSSSLACGFSSIKIDYSDYPKSLISSINEVNVFSIKYRYIDILLKKYTLHLRSLFCCNHTCYCVNLVSVTSVPEPQNISHTT